MRRHARGISETVAIALLIVVAIALAVAIYFATQRFMTTSDFVQVQAFKVQNKYTTTSSGTSQIAIVGLRLIPKTDKYLTIVSVKAFLTLANGQTATVTFSPPASGSTTWSGSGATGVTASGEGPATINPGSTIELTFTFSKSITQNDHILSVSFQVTVQDPSGAQYTFTSNEVMLT